MQYEVHLDEATAAEVEASGLSLHDLIKRGLDSSDGPGGYPQVQAASPDDSVGLPRAKKHAFSF